MYQHDHCNSVFLRTVQTTDGILPPGIRACAQCARCLTPKIVLTCGFQDSTLGLCSMTGSLVSSITSSELPGSLIELQVVLRQAWLRHLTQQGHAPTTAVATDGYAYTPSACQEYYGERYWEDMWQFACLRTLQIQVIFDNIVINDAIYQTWLGKS